MEQKKISVSISDTQILDLQNGKHVEIEHTMDYEVVLLITLKPEIDDNFIEEPIDDTLEE